jgi:hypothetical protein
MSSQEPHLEFVRVCGFPNELEASMIEQMLNEEGVTTRVTGSSGTTVFGGLPFEEGYQIFVPHSQVEKTRLLLSKHPHFHGLDKPGET